MPETKKTKTRWKILAKVALAFVGLYVALTALLFGGDAAIAGSFCGDDETRALAGFCGAAIQTALASGTGGAGERRRYGAGFFA